mmetsp:Transcript_2731/g.9173  ORF Transcript_2731/g.9173 Transcript_2731/m.9173 type:complete len:84 (-) Transcript_2731:684-935(-)
MADTKNANKNKATKARQLARRVSSDEEHPLLRHAGPSSLYEQIAELEAEVSTRLSRSSFRRPFQSSPARPPKRCTVRRWRTSG